MQIVLEEPDPQLALERAHEYLMDQILVAATQSGFAGTQFVRSITRVFRDNGNECGVIAYGPFYNEALRIQFIQAGAQGFFGLDQSSESMLELIRTSRRRDFIVDYDTLKLAAKDATDLKIPANFAMQLEKLNAEQKKILRSFLKGLSDTKNAQQFDIARTRVTALISSLMQSGGYATRSQLAIALIRRGK
jgi:DNA-binding NarL/FixJ family response regulator